jgi:hypothetical protein
VNIHVIAFEGFDKRFGHAVGLRASNQRAPPAETFTRGAKSLSNESRCGGAMSLATELLAIEYGLLPSSALIKRTIGCDAKPAAAATINLYPFNFPRSGLRGTSQQCT